VARTVGLLSALLLVATVAWAAEQVVVEDWSKAPVGHKGLPPGWKGQQWGSPAYDLTVVENSGRKVLHLKSKDESSTISKEVKDRVNLEETSEEFNAPFYGSDVIIAKGMANWETLTEVSAPCPLMYVFRTKCEPVARAVCAPLNVNIAKLVPKGWKL